MDLPDDIMTCVYRETYARYLGKWNIQENIYDAKDIYIYIFREMYTNKYAKYHGKYT